MNKFRPTKREKAELYDHMLEVAKANGFDCLTAAIVDGVKYRKLMADRACGEEAGRIESGGLLYSLLTKESEAT